jgi:phosphopantetheinyl transferase (holo-ACP synthase)
MAWRRCEIANLPSGQPVIVLHGELKDWFEARGLRAHVTVTDETDYAASFVVVEKDSP